MIMECRVPRGRAMDTSLPLDMNEAEECELMLMALERHLHAVEEQLTTLTSAEESKRKSQRQKRAMTPKGKSDARAGSEDAKSALTRSTETVTRGKTDPKMSVPDRESKKQKMKREERILTTAEKEQVEKRRELDRKKREFQLRLVDLLEEVKLDRRDEEHAALKCRVAKQRKRIRERDLAYAERCRKKEDELQRDIEQRPKRDRSSGVDDFKFLRKVSRTSFYQIVSEEQELLRHGKIRSVSQLQDFWKENLVRHGLMKLPPAPLRKSHRATSSLIFSGASDRSNEIAEEDEEDDDGDERVNTWAVTGMIPENSVVSPVKKREKNEMSTVSLKVILSKVEPPTLASLQLDLRAKKPSPELIKRREEIEKLTQDTSVKRVLVQRMMLQAKQHQAHGERLISSISVNEDSCTNYFSLPKLPPRLSLTAGGVEESVDSLLSSSVDTSDRETSLTDLEQVTPLSQDFPSTSYISEARLERASHSKIETGRQITTESLHVDDEMPETKEDAKPQGCSSSPKPQGCSSSPKPQAQRSVIPLTLSSLVATDPIKISKGRSGLWMNYAST